MMPGAAMATAIEVANIPTSDAANPEFCASHSRSMCDPKEKDEKEIVLTRLSP
jgi:hypothetical protein